jgi:hypothetical protein
MAVQELPPNGRLLMEGLGFNLQRLRGGGKAAVPLPLMQAILSVAAASLRFDPEFYLATYADVRQAYEGGNIKDLREHFIEVGYFEGRMGARPEFDENFYMTQYPDVAAAIARGEVRSAFDHYIQAGSFEGRHATELAIESNKWWSEHLRLPP